MLTVIFYIALRDPNLVVGDLNAALTSPHTQRVAIEPEFGEHVLPCDQACLQHLKKRPLNRFRLLRKKQPFRHVEFVSNRGAANHVDWLALSASALAIVISTYTWDSSRRDSKASLAVDMCWKFYAEEDMAEARKMVRSGRDPQGRWIGDIYNALNVVSLARVEGKVDENIMRGCFENDYVAYCEYISTRPERPPEQGKYKIYWKATNEIISDAGYWTDNKVPAVCEKAKRFMAKNFE